jgi:hypothetical protein
MPTKKIYKRKKRGGIKDDNTKTIHDAIQQITSNNLFGSVGEPLELKNPLIHPNREPPPGEIRTMVIRRPEDATSGIGVNRSNDGRPASNNPFICGDLLYVNGINIGQIPYEYFYRGSFIRGGFGLDEDGDLQIHYFPNRGTGMGFPRSNWAENHPAGSPVYVDNHDRRAKIRTSPLEGGKKNKTRKQKGGGGEDDKHDEKAVEGEMLGWKPGSRVLPDKVADNILLQRKILMLEDAIKATTERPRYPYNENGLESFQGRREYLNAHTESLHALGQSVKLAVTKTKGSDAPERSGDSDYQKVKVAFSSPPDYEVDGPKWLAGKDFVKNHPFLIGDTIYIRTGSTNDEKYEQVLGKITNFEEKFIPYTEIPEGAIANIGVGTPLVPYKRDESFNRIRNEKGQPLAKYHDSVAEDMWPDPAHAAIVAEERAKNPPGMYVLEISYDSNRPPGDSGLIDKYHAYLYRGDPVSLRFDYRDYHGYGPYNFAQAHVYTKLADRRARLKELKAALAKGKRQKKSIPDDGAGPGKVKGGGRKTRKRKGGGDRDQSVREEMSDWKPGFDHPGRTLPVHVLENITGHLEAQEEAEVNPRYRFPYPPRILKQTMDKVDEPPPLAYPPPPKLTEEEKNNMIIQQYTSIPDSGKILPMKFIVSENDPETGTPFKVNYGEAGRIQFLYLKAVGDVPWWDESWLEPKKFHQSFKFPRPAPVIDDARSRILGPDAPAYDNRRGDILVAIDPFSERDDKVIAEIGEVKRFPMSCNPHRLYTTHCFKINFTTPKELDFTSDQSEGDRRRPYELTLPPQTVIRVIRGRKKDYPPITTRETFRAPPKGGKKKKHKTHRQKKKRGKKTRRSK